MKLIRQIEDRRLEEMFKGERCKECGVLLGDDPQAAMERHPELEEYCKVCGEEMQKFHDYDYVGEARP